MYKNMYDYILYYIFIYASHNAFIVRRIRMSRVSAGIDMGK